MRSQGKPTRLRRRCLGRFGARGGDVLVAQRAFQGLPRKLRVTLNGLMTLRAWKLKIAHRFAWLATKRLAAGAAIGRFGVFLVTS